MSMQTVWHGNEKESCDLLATIGRNCACTYAPNGARTGNCGPHDALIHSQRFLDGLLFAHRMRSRFIAEEWLTAPPPIHLGARAYLPTELRYTPA